MMVSSSAAWVRGCPLALVSGSGRRDMGPASQENVGVLGELDILRSVFGD
jgi:hypothetical protein